MLPGEEVQEGPEPDRHAEVHSQPGVEVHVRQDGRLAGEEDQLRYRYNLECGYMIRDYNFPLIKYAQESDRFSMASLMVGIIQNIIESAGFDNTTSYH